MFQYLPEALGGYQIWTIFALFLCTDIIMEVWWQRALRDFRALYVVPIVSAMLLTGR